jgi:hypothetical protein
MVTVYHSSVVAGDIWQMVVLCAGKAHAQLHVARSQLPMRVRTLVGAFMQALSMRAHRLLKRWSGCGLQCLTHCFAAATCSRSAGESHRAYCCSCNPQCLFACNPHCLAHWQLYPPPLPPVCAAAGDGCCCTTPTLPLTTPALCSQAQHAMPLEIYLNPMTCLNPLQARHNIPDPQLCPHSCNAQVGRRSRSSTCSCCCCSSSGCSCSCSQARQAWWWRRRY